MRLLNDALGGRLLTALVEIVRDGGEPELLGLRVPTTPPERSSWLIVVRGANQEFRFDADQSPIAAGFAAHFWLIDTIRETKLEIAQRFGAAECSGSAERYFHTGWFGERPHKPKPS